ncbi:aldo/keto reductase [Candidatus Woesearchaeota archaeon]|nr:aldo/keto reductase [Candidatus Woesearchaeota archaeon]
MKYKKLYNNIKIPPIGLGTGGIGRLLDTIIFKNRKSVNFLKQAISLGVKHIDTAEIYGNGCCERLIGKAIKTFNRESLFITSKVSPQNLGYKDLINSAKKSLQRLRTNYIDLYLIHGYNKEIPMHETMKAMDYLVFNGLARFIGVSNFSVEELKEAQDNSENKISANQIEYNLLVRDYGKFTKNMESRIIPYCQKNKIIIIAYRSLAKGKLARPGIKILDEMSEKYKKTQSQIAIKWLISKYNVVTIPKTLSLEHLKENLDAAEKWVLDRDDMLTLDNGLKM